jgi:hypothetical protein
MRFPFGPVLAAAIGAGISGCKRDQTPFAAPLPASLERRSLDSEDTADLAEFLLQWHPRDWRAHLARGLTLENPADRRRSFSRAAALRSGEPMVLYFLALEFMADSNPASDSAALELLDAALSLDSDNGVLDLTRAVTLSRLGFYAEARAVFRSTRGFPQGDLYAARLESALVGLLDRGLRFNPYDLIQAQTWYRGMPLPPLELWMEALEGIFLDPLQAHPYDIRLRGKEAALGLHRLGRRIEVNSLRVPRVFSDGREERLVGVLLQARAAEFLRHYSRALGSVPGPLRLEPAYWESRLESSLRVAARIPPDWEDFLSAWERLGGQEPGIILGKAVGRMRDFQAWKNASRCRIPVLD